MSLKARERLKMIHRIEPHELTVALGAEALHLSERQLYRSIKRYRQQGDAGLIHRQRGQPSHRAYPIATKAKALRLYFERYGPSH
ncbi:MAG: helix-turn-helix domain-containing protein, partial [candidate division KSB1 bacterium]|nr:helix-turn-helix domain-containing protein [candidate division KSB1 bacterium]